MKRCHFSWDAQKGEQESKHSLQARTCRLKVQTQVPTGKQQLTEMWGNPAEVCLGRNVLFHSEMRPCSPQPCCWASLQSKARRWAGRSGSEAGTSSSKRSRCQLVPQWAPLPLANKRNPGREDGYFFFLDASLPSSQSASFPIKVVIPCSNKLSADLLACRANGNFVTINT